MSLNIMWWDGIRFLLLLLMEARALGNLQPSIKLCGGNSIGVLWQRIHAYGGM